jgi:hypothetical protein
MGGFDTAKWVGIGLLCLAAGGYLTDVSYLVVILLSTAGVIAVVYSRSVSS